MYGFSVFLSYTLLELVSDFISNNCSVSSYQIVVSSIVSLSKGMTNSKTERRNPHGCYYSGKNGHIKRYYYKFEAKVRMLVNQQMYYAYYNDFSRVCVRKVDKYQKLVVPFTLQSSQLRVNLGILTVDVPHT